MKSFYVIESTLWIILFFTSILVYFHVSDNEKLAAWIICIITFLFATTGTYCLYQIFIKKKTMGPSLPTEG